MLFTAKLNKKIWIEVALATIYLYNRTLHSTLEFKSFYETQYQKQSNLNNTKIWGSLTYNKEHLVKKLNARAKSCILIDYDASQYKLFDLRTKRTFWSRDVNILEDVFLNTYNAKNDTKDEISDFAYDENIDFQTNISNDQVRDNSRNWQKIDKKRCRDVNTNNSQDIVSNANNDFDIDNSDDINVNIIGNNNNNNISRDISKNTRGND